MKNKLVASWPKDFATDLPMVPPGEFTTFDDYPNLRQPQEVKKLPVLRGLFSRKLFDMKPGLPTHMGWGSIRMSLTSALTFRIQCGQNMVYWLANPADPEVWEVLDQWASAGCLVLSPAVEDGQAGLVSRDFSLTHPDFASLRSAVSDPEYTKYFLADATRFIANNEAKLMATSDIPSIKKLKAVQACLVRTKHTGGVAVLLDERTSSAEGAVGVAARNLANAMLRPDQTRH